MPNLQRLMSENYDTQSHFDHGPRGSGRLSYQGQYDHEDINRGGSNRFSNRHASNITIAKPARDLLSPNDAISKQQA